MRRCFIGVNLFDSFGIGCQVSGVRIDGGVIFWGFRKDAMATKDFLDLAGSRGIGSI